MTCGECKHYEPSRYLSTNRPIRGQPGHCLYVVVWPKMPKALQSRNEMSDSGWSFSLPQRQRMEKDNGRECAVFTAK